MKPPWSGHRRPSHKTSLAQMNANRKAPTGHFHRPLTSKEAGDKLEAAERAESAAKREQATRAKAAEDSARAARVREEERAALLAKVTKLPASERAQFIEEERIVAQARAHAVKLRAAAPVEADLGRMFGIELDDGEKKKA